MITMKNLIAPSIIVAIFYLHLIYAHQTHTHREDNSRWDNSTNSTNCTQPGQFCLSCNETLICEYENGSLSGRVENCRFNSSCSSINGTCTENFNEECDWPFVPEFEFECRTEGVFPDPYDCKKYYYCVPLNVTSANGTSVNTTLIRYPTHCSCDSRYNPLTKVCDTYGICYWYPVGSCFERGETNPLSNNPNIYYICDYYKHTKHLYPFIYSCEHGKKYNASKYLCE